MKTTWAVKRLLRLAVRLLTGVSLGVALLLPAVASQGPNAVVGEVIMAIGVSRIFGEAGQALPIDKGTDIRVGDRIETGAGGHVHLRFVDGGRVSVRPASRLVIESYVQGAPATLTAIKFRLDEGVVRSITGAWGEAARDRFRLNTPVAAIGVKGTDFTVKTGQGGTSASVYTGAILLSPMADTCQATLGPCLNGGEKILSGDMRGHMLQLIDPQAVVQLVPIGQGRRVTVAGDGRDKLLSISDLAAEKAVVSDTRGATVTASLAPQINQLVWGRWGAPFEGDNFSKLFEEAGNNRESTVGNGRYGLYRDLTGVSPAQLDGEVNFRLATGAASYLGEGRPAEAARVDGGTLRVDFSRATFATQLNVSSPSIGTDNVQANGVVHSNGIFQAQAGNAFVAGTLSNDRKEAGYFFEKALPAGSLSGITLWGR